MSNGTSTNSTKNRKVNSPAKFFVDIVAYYKRCENAGRLKFEYDKKHRERPAWIKILNRPKGVNFLKLKIGEYQEVIYRSFGDYFYPIDATPRENRIFMDYIAKDYDVITRKNNPFLAEFLIKKLEKLNLPKNASVIDLGAGTGVALAILKQKGYQNLTLFDRSKEMLAMAKRKSELHNAHFIVGDVSRDLPKERYDLVISVMLFDCFNDKTLKVTLAKWANCLKKDGVFAIIEDAGRPLYKNIFEVIEEGKVRVNRMGKYYFIGRKR